MGPLCVSWISLELRLQSKKQYIPAWRNENSVRTLKKGQYRDRLSEILDGYKSRSILQLMIGLWAGARTMVEVRDTGKDLLVKRFLENPVEEAQLGRDFKSFDRSQVESLYDFNVSQTIFDLAQKIPHSETLYFDIGATRLKNMDRKKASKENMLAKFFLSRVISIC